MRIWPIVAASLLLAGCGASKNGDDPKPEASLGPDRSMISAPTRLMPPDFVTKSTLKMVRHGDELHVGDTSEDALRVFKEEKNAFQLTDLPPGWKDDSFKCIGWDTGTMGFGAITYGDRMAFGLYHEDRVKEDRLQEMLDTYEKSTEIAPVQVTGSRVRYWFWEEGPQRLMICAVSVPNDGTLNVSIALGDIHVMDLFRMNKDLADKDKDLSEDLFKQGLDAKRDQSTKP